MTRQYVDQIFQSAEYNIFGPLQWNDTIVLYNWEVSKNISEGKLLTVLEDAYKTWLTDRKNPDALAHDIVSAALSMASQQSSTADGMICIVAYVVDSS